MEKTDVPVDEATLNGSNVAVAFTLKLIVAEVALIPSTVPLSRNAPEDIDEAEFQKATFPFTPVPVTGFTIVFCLLLNVVQSVAVKVPVAEAEALGIFRVKLLVEVD